MEEIRCLVLYEDGSVAVGDSGDNQTLPELGSILPGANVELLGVFVPNEPPIDVVKLIDAIDEPLGYSPKGWVSKLDAFAEYCVRAGEARILRKAKERGITIKLD